VTPSTLATQPERASPAPQPTSKAGPAVASFDHVSKSYRSVQAIRDVTLTIGAGELVALLGPNGAGKSTAIHLLLGLLPPSSGQVRVFGHDPAELATRTRIGAMLQDIGPPATLKVRELIDLFSTYYPNPLPLKNVLEQADLIGLESRRVGQLSGGQRKRVRFALAICGNPSLVYLDEPTANLDAEARRKLHDCIREKAAAGVSIILATHLLEEADQLASRVVLLNKGQVLRDSTPAAIKGEVGMQHVTCRTRITPEEALAIPGVRHAVRVDNRLDLRVDEQVALAPELYRRDPELTELTIERASLEEAMLALLGADQ
jgi:ABC-2 type transport system ATP-binding protein